MPAFHLAVCLGAFLLFLVQPLIAKRLLPWFGGGPVVWSTCLMFFQAALVAGYGYAHLARRLGPRRQVWLHLVLLAGAVVALPIVPPETMKPAGGGQPVGPLLAVLVASVGVPFVMLAATAPLLQDWFTLVRPGRSPYPLYVVSNAGALGALLAYPTIVEPQTTLDAQSRTWSAAFVVFALVVGWCGRRVLSGAAADRRPPEATEFEGAIDRPRAADRALWILLPGLGTALLTATTSQLSQDIAALPLIWIAPLALYLVSYIAGFAGWYRRGPTAAVMIVAIAVAQYAMAPASGWALRVQVVWLLAALTAACLVCHGELSRLRPGARHLTGFYFAISAGGAVGGVFVAVLAPLLFDRFVELPLLHAVAVALVFVLVARDTPRLASAPARAWPIAAASLAVMLGAGTLALDARWSHEVARTRNFYGVLRVREEPAADRLAMRSLYHGRVLHGAQFLAEDRRHEPTTYYGRADGVALAIARHPRRLAGEPLTIGAIGLGAGTLAAWGEPGDRIRFYEIDDAVVDAARTRFSFLGDSRAAVDVVLGDARLSLEREIDAPDGRHRYDVLAIDAFSGDAIPVHLLTRESFRTYRTALAPDGIIAVHVSNRYLDLKPVVYGLADEAGLAVVPISLAAVPAARAPGSTWLLVTANAAFVAGVADVPTLGSPPARRLVWTDDFSSLLSVLR